MVCFTPMKAYAGAEKTEAGKRPVIFSGTKAFGAVSLTRPLLYTLPCGGCLGCRMDRATAWAIRCTHEARMHELYEGGGGSAFITLTISPEHLLAHNSVLKKSLQRFWKKLRFHSGVRIRYLDCGEYGDRNGRCHYHAAVFGYNFPDRVPYGSSRTGHQLYRSDILEKAWPWGRASIGEVTLQSARYVASYVTKKVGGDNADAHYTRVSPVDGEFYRVKEEFASMSLKPGLGERWFDKFHGDVFPADEVVLRDGTKRKPPRYYDKLYLAKFGEEAFQALKVARAKRAAEAGEADRTRERMATREESATIKHRRFERSVD